MTYSKTRQLQRKKDPKKLLDKMFSEIIRRRAILRAGGCERCGTRYDSFKRLQCSHVIGRSNYKVRWDTINAFGLCAGCHMHVEHHPVDHIAFAKDKLGSIQFDLLVARSAMSGKVDYELLRLYLKAELEKMG